MNRCCKLSRPERSATRKSLSPIHPCSARGQNERRADFQDGAFGPDDIKAMSIAFDEVCCKHDLTDDQQEEREVLAKRIIAFAHHGERNPTVLRDGALRQLAVRAWRGLSRSNIIGPDDRT